MDLVKKLFQGDERSAARLISLIEEGSSEGFEAIRLIYPHVGSAQKIGIIRYPFRFIQIIIKIKIISEHELR